MKSNNSRELLQSMNNSSINNPSSQMSLHHHHHHHHHLQIPNSTTRIHSSNFDQSPSNDDFLDQMFSTLPDFSLSNPNDDRDDSPLSYPQQFEYSSLLAAKLSQHQIGAGNPAAMEMMMIHQKTVMSRGVPGRSPSSEGSGNGEYGLIPLPLSLNGGGDLIEPSHNEVVDGSVHGHMNGFDGCLHGSGLASNQSQQFHNLQSFGAPTNGSSGGGGGLTQPRQRIRARRGQATDPHSIAERLRRERIAERMKALQELVPNANKTDKASMLDEIIDYVKFLQLQVKVLSTSRLGGAPSIAPLDISPRGGNECVQTNGEGRNNKSTRTGPTSDNTPVTEHHVIKLMEQDMGSAMQYLQGKGLCLMPISLATAISTATSHSRSHLISSVTNGGEESPPSPNLSALTVQSTTVGSNGVKDIGSISSP